MSIHRYKVVTVNQTRYLMNRTIGLRKYAQIPKNLCNRPQFGPLSWVVNVHGEPSGSLTHGNTFEFSDREGKVAEARDECRRDVYHKPGLLPRFEGLWVDSYQGQQRRRPTSSVLSQYTASVTLKVCSAERRHELPLTLRSPAFASSSAFSICFRLTGAAPHVSRLDSSFECAFASTRRRPDRPEIVQVLAMP